MSFETGSPSQEELGIKKPAKPKKDLGRKMSEETEKIPGAVTVMSDEERLEQQRRKRGELQEKIAQSRESGITASVRTAVDKQRDAKAQEWAEKATKGEPVSISDMEGSIRRRELGKLKEELAVALPKKVEKPAEPAVLSDIRTPYEPTAPIVTGRKSFGARFADSITGGLRRLFGKGKTLEQEEAIFDERQEQTAEEIKAHLDEMEAPQTTPIVTGKKSLGARAADSTTGGLRKLFGAKTLEKEEAQFDEKQARTADKLAEHFDKTGADNVPETAEGMMKYSGKEKGFKYDPVSVKKGVKDMLKGELIGENQSKMIVDDAVFIEKIAQLDNVDWSTFSATTNKRIEELKRQLKKEGIKLNKKGEPGFFAKKKALKSDTYQAFLAFKDLRDRVLLGSPVKSKATSHTASARKEIDRQISKIGKTSR